MAKYTPETFAARVLRRLGIKPNSENMKALVGWQRAEGGHWNNDARYNPLNTTQPMRGAGNTGTQGNIKVYRTPKQGVRATVKTLRNGRYEPILQALSSGSASDVANAIGQSPWGTHGDLVSRTIGSTSAPKIPDLPAVRPGGGRRQRRSGGGVETITTTTPGVDNSQARRAALTQYLAERHKPNALLNLALTLRQYPDIPGTTEVTTVETGGGGRLRAAKDGGKGASGKESYYAKVERRADRIDRQRLPYQWGGGHQVKRVKIKDAMPLDCSGAVSAALNVDVRVSGEFEKFGKPGRAPRGKGITIYANAEHVLMEINGRFWGTSKSNPGGGAGWIPRSAVSESYLSRFTARHI